MKRADATGFETGEVLVSLVEELDEEKRQNAIKLRRVRKHAGNGWFAAAFLWGLMGFVSGAFLSPIPWWLAVPLAVFWWFVLMAMVVKATDF